MVHCGLASEQKYSIFHALYGVVNTESRPACTLFKGSQKKVYLVSATNQDYWGGRGGGGGVGVQGLNPSCHFMYYSVWPCISTVIGGKPCFVTE